MERVFVNIADENLGSVRGKSSRDFAPNPRSPRRDENTLLHHQLLQPELNLSVPGLTVPGQAFMTQFSASIPFPKLCIHCPRNLRVPSFLGFPFSQKNVSALVNIDCWLPHCRDIQEYEGLLRVLRKGLKHAFLSRD
jgi:hypothetical protein